MSILNFEKFITPSIIKWVWIIGSIFITLGGIFFAVLGGSYLIRNGSLQNFIELSILSIFTILLIIFGNIVWRIYCEYLIIQFKIYDKLNTRNWKNS